MKKRRLLDLTRPGWAIAFASAVLISVGVASIYAAKSVHVGGNLTSATTFAVKQVAFALVSLGAAVIVLRIGFMWFGRHAYLICGICILLLIPLVIAKTFNTSFGGLTPNLRGSHRSIKIPGIQLQPSEFMKIAYILGLAWYLRFRKNYRSFQGLMWPVGLTVIPMGLVLREPDLGTALLFIPMMFGMLFTAGARKRHLGVIIAVGLLAMPLMWMKIRPYQRLRVTAVLLQSQRLRADIIRDPDKYQFLGVDKREALEWRASSGMQLVRSKAALGSGGLVGEGWGCGTYVRHNLLPDRHNDFVFALVGHQWGLLGCLVVLACYAVIVLAGAEIAMVTKEPFGRLLAVGVVCLFAAQTLINVGMTVGIMPITGMTLPFVSYGGSSLLSNFVAAALLISVSRHRPFTLAERPFEWSNG